MRKLKNLINYKAKLLRALFFVICIGILIAVPIMAATSKNNSASARKDDMSVLNVWQIDSFEGGKGSRAAYLQNTGNEFSENSGCYVTVTSLTATAARENLKSGNVPDLISYGAGTYGLESYIVGNTPYFCWCNGGYCILTVTEGADFSDISTENTVINAGTDNLAEVCALFCGLYGADVEKPTGAYVKLINGKYKYLLGTQRDIYRLKTRGVAFAVKPVAEFNDLFQNISITTKNKVKTAQSFIDFLLKKRETINKLGLMADGVKLYDDEMSAMEGLTYGCTLKSPVSGNTKNEINSALKNCDIKKLKTLFN